MLTIFGQGFNSPRLHHFLTKFFQASRSEAWTNLCQNPFLSACPLVDFTIDWLILVRVQKQILWPQGWSANNQIAGHSLHGTLPSLETRPGSTYHLCIPRSFHYPLSSFEQTTICLRHILAVAVGCLSELKKDNHDLPSGSIVPKADRLL